MNEVKIEQEQQENVKKENVSKMTPTNVIMLVQSAVCLFAVLLVLLLGKLSPETFEYIKNEYRQIMSVDKSVSEIGNSAKEVIGEVIETGESRKEEKSENETQLSNIPSAEDGEAVAVMMNFKSDDEITVPVHGRITSEYGNRTNPVSGEYLMHSGVDIAADMGTEIRAAYNGVVSKTDSDNVSGNYISLVHTDGSETTYCHCSKIVAKEGDVVRAGETIALVGSTGRSTGPHLHFQIKIDGSTVDPLLYLPVENGRV